MSSGPRTDFLVLRYSRADLDKNLDMVIFVVYECLETLFFDFLHLDYPCYRWFRFEFPYVVCYE